MNVTGYLIDCGMGDRRAGKFDLLCIVYNDARLLTV